MSNVKPEQLAQLAQNTARHVEKWLESTEEGLKYAAQISCDFSALFTTSENKLAAPAKDNLDSLVHLSDTRLLQTKEKCESLAQELHEVADNPHAPDALRSLERIFTDFVVTSTKYHKQVGKHLNDSAHHCRDLFLGVPVHHGVRRFDEEVPVCLQSPAPTHAQRPRTPSPKTPLPASSLASFPETAKRRYNEFVPLGLQSPAPMHAPLLERKVSDIDDLGESMVPDAGAAGSTTQRHTQTQTLTRTVGHSHVQTARPLTPLHRAHTVSTQTQTERPTQTQRPSQALSQTLHRDTSDVTGDAGCGEAGAGVLNPFDSAQFRAFLQSPRYKPKKSRTLSVSSEIDQPNPWQDCEDAGANPFTLHEESDDGEDEVSGAVTTANRRSTALHPEEEEKTEREEPRHGHSESVSTTGSSEISLMQLPPRAPITDEDDTDSHTSLEPEQL
ncbi:MAG: hypothetical protein MHM6MM_000666 [Cercozoa sp. M6MM]